MQGARKQLLIILVSHFLAVAPAAFAQTSDFNEIVSEIEAGEGSSIVWAVWKMAQNPQERSPLSAAKQPHLILWLAPLLLDDKFSGKGTSPFSPTQKEVIAKLLLTHIAGSSLFSKETSSWAAAKLRTKASCLESARELLLWNLHQFQYPGLPSLKPPGQH